MATDQTSDLDFADDLFLTALFQGGGREEEEGGNFDVLVSDAKYAEELQFQEALMSSYIASQIQNCKAPSQSAITVVQVIAPVSDLDGGGDVAPPKLEESGESSSSSASSSRSFCEICFEKKESDEMFVGVRRCVHSFCSDCVIKHLAAKIGDRAKTLTCPGLNCTEALQLDTCRPMLPKELIELWEDSLCQELIGTTKIYYCPYKDCTAPMLVDDESSVRNIRESECPYCHRLFCARCNVGWHSGVECEEFERLGEDERGKEDFMVMELAKDKKWRRCPQCRFYVERTEGCPHMICRCKFEFCYGCGAEWTPSHGGCHRQ